MLGWVLERRMSLNRVGGDAPDPMQDHHGAVPVSPSHRVLVVVAVVGTKGGDVDMVVASNPAEDGLGDGSYAAAWRM